MDESGAGSGARPTRRGFLQQVGATAALATLPAASLGQRPAGQRPAPPNILFILADDLGYADLSCYGRRDYRTPVLDRLAAEGLLMTQAYANSAVCSPTRVALITGRYHQRLPVGLPEPIPRNEGQGLPAGFPTLPAILKRVGYRTSLVGKWHLGWPPEHGPLHSGYDRFFGIAAGAADYFSHREHNPGGEVRQGLFEGDVLAAREGYLTDLLADRAVDEIRAYARAPGPFFLSLHFTAPHWPWEAPGDALVAASITDLWHRDGGSLETYAEMVRSMDSAIGRVLAELEARALAANTMVIFTSDNGGERFSDTWPLRGNKGELLEGGIRVPLLVRWPDGIAAATRSDQVIASMDWLPTLAAVARVAPDPASPPDGENLLSVLRGAEPMRPRRICWRMRAKDQAAVRDGDWKYLRIESEEFLFNIPRDPRERANLKTREAAIFDRLKQVLARWNAAMLPYPEEPA